MFYESVSFLTSHLSDPQILKSSNPQILKMEKILVSACLLGEKVRYNGGAATSDDPSLRRWLAEGRVVSFCPEMEGGLGTPRPRAERRGSLVITEEGADVTAAFARGAALALETTRRLHIRIAVLKEGSPSCGSSEVHDGTFSGQRTAGAGVTTDLLRASGVRVFSDRQIADADACLSALETR
jgi:uncharacterized protein YbbK (DUF523 family)